MTATFSASSRAQANFSSSGSTAEMSSITYMPPSEPRTVTSFIPRTASRKTARRAA